MSLTDSSKKPSLVIPDTHQNIEWVNAIVEQRASQVGRIIFLGDYFDPKVSSASSPAETAHYFSNLHKKHSNPLSFLVGNHDLPYLYDLKRDRFPTPYTGNPYTNGAYNPALSAEIKAEISSRFVRSLQPFAISHGWILSHAGIHSSFFQTSDAEDLSSITSFQRRLTADLDTLADERSLPLSAVGEARRGLEAFGGITWQDWFAEFEDHLPWPQIVGHTLIPEPEQKGRSWNIDTKSGSYALLSPKGVEIKFEAK